jgi:hypothetical protein
MLPRPAHHDEAALDVTARATHHWMRFFAALRMTTAGSSHRDAISKNKKAAPKGGFLVPELFNLHYKERNGTRARGANQQ